MTKFEANNYTNLRNLFVDRILYEAFALTAPGATTPLSTPVGIKDYWSRENLLYGKVDKNFAAIAVRKVVLGTYSQGNDVITALDPVLSAFKDMRSLFMQRLRNGQISSDPYLGEIKIERGFTDPDVEYNIYLTQLVEDFNKHMMASQKDLEVKDIRDYARLFFDYCLNGTAVSFITRTAFYLSSRVSALNSGLSLEVASLDPSDNSKKQEFINSPNFQFYRESATNFGFLIDKNIPWRLNYDLSSPVNRAKMQFGATPDPVADFLSANFYKIYYDDLGYLTSAVILGYNTFVDFRPEYKEGLCVFRRQKVDKSYVVNQVLGLPYWIRKYIMVKNKENNHKYTPPELEKIIFNAIDLGTVSAPSYIQGKFDTPYTFEGSTTYRLLKREFKQNKNFPLDKFHEHVIMLIKKATDKIY